MSNEESKSVFLSLDLYSKIEGRLKDTGFDSVNEYVKFVLEEILREEDQIEHTYGKEEEEEVKERLRGMGYSN